MKESLRLPLIVDLDNTLIRTDCLLEALFYNLKKNFFKTIIFFFIHFFNKKKIKSYLFSDFCPDINSIKVNKKIYDFLSKERSNGRKIYLCSGSPSKVVKQFSEKLKIFDGYFGTENVNLVGENKKNFLNEKFKIYQYDYIGDSYSDITVWKNSNQAIVSKNNILIKIILKIKKIKFITITEKNKVISNVINLLKLIRIHHWCKNILLFLPIFLAQDFSIRSIVFCSIGFLAFSLIASCIYIVNDCLDIQNDRLHPEKKNRILASGKILLLDAMFISLTLAIISISFSTFIGTYFTILICFYFITNILYSITIKNLIIFDIICLSLFYVSRVIAGGLSTNTFVSIWLLLFCFFFFLFLANIKRITELVKINNDLILKKVGRNYSLSNLKLLKIINIFAIVTSQLVLFIYFINDSSSMLYSKSNIIIIISMILMIWTYYISKNAFSGILSSDPIVFALKNKFSWLCFFVIAFLTISQMKIWLF